MKIKRYHKERDQLMTNERWPWKLESFKECVTTHRSKLIASKMDGAEIFFRPFAVKTVKKKNRF